VRDVEPNFATQIKSTSKLFRAKGLTLNISDAKEIEKIMTMNPSNLSPHAVGLQT
jgi:hypothetical protein